MLSVRVDTFPVVVTTFGEGFDEGDFRLFRDAHAAIIERAEPYVAVVDTSALVTIPSIGLREEVAEFTRVYADSVAIHCLSTEMVVKSIAVRTALNAVQWLAPSPSLVSMHASLRPAVSRALDVVWTHQLETSPTLFAYHEEIMSSHSIPPERQSGSFGKRTISSSIEGLLRRVRRDERG